MGGKLPGEGSWQFIQANKDGKQFRYVLFFPEDLCVILDETDDQRFVAAFTRSGKVISKENTKWRDENEKPDPFEADPKVRPRKS